MKKIFFYLLLLSLTSLQAAVYQGRTAYIGFCKDCHGNGTKMAKKYTGDEWREFLDKSGVVLAQRHTASSGLASLIAQQQSKGLLPYSTEKTIKAYFENKSEIVLKSMSKSEKKATKKRIYKYQARHLKDFFIEFSKDSGKVPACSDDTSGSKASKEEQAQAERIQEAERQRRAKKVERQKEKLARMQEHEKQAKENQDAKRLAEKSSAREAALKRQEDQAKRQKELEKRAQESRAQAIALRKAKERETRQKAGKDHSKKSTQKSVTDAELAKHSLKENLTPNEKIVKLLEDKLSESDLNQLKILLLSR